MAGNFFVSFPYCSPVSISHTLPLPTLMPSERSGMKVSYTLTQYGVNFVLAVRPKRPSERGMA